MLLDELKDLLFGNIDEFDVEDVFGFLIIDVRRDEPIGRHPHHA
jgi:hypothetical protein